MVAEFWLRSFWKTTKKRGTASEKHLIGVLAFEVSRLMSKTVHLWQSLSDKQVAILREEIMNLAGIRKLVSEDDAHIVRLICVEIIENLGNVAMAVSRLAKNCHDPLLRNFEQAFNDLVKLGSDPCGWQMSWRKMERKVKKMERFVVISSNLYQEMETLSDVSHTLQRMKCCESTDGISLVDCEKKMAWKQQEVRHLKEVSLWNRSYDYAVRLLARSVFTIFSRIGHVFGINNPLGDSNVLDSDYIHRSQSVAHMQSTVHPTETGLSRFASEPLENLLAKSGPISKATKMNSFYSGPIRNSSLVSGWHKTVNFYSGPLGKSGPISRANKSAFKWWHLRDRSRKGKTPLSKPNKLTYIKGLDAPADGNMVFGHLPGLTPRKSLMNAPPGTLGAAALALHYANVIIVIEKLVVSPHLIGHDARDDLYSMLPNSIRLALRSKLKPYAKELSSSLCDIALADEWNEALAGILEWLAPLAHNMIRWQSERSFEHQIVVSRTNVLLVQTLYFANQAKIEATITELLVGLNYIWRYGRELNAKAIDECDSVRTFEEYLD